MPHDKNGNLLEPGDIVMVTFVVREVYTGDEFCNAQLQTVEPMYPSDRCDYMTINARQCELVKKHERNVDDGA